MIISKGSLMIVDTEPGLGMLVQHCGKFVNIANNDVFVCLEDVIEVANPCVQIWRVIKVLTSFGVLDAPIWMLHERARILVNHVKEC